MRRTGTFGSGKQTPLSTKTLYLSPHTLLFLFYNFIYFVPLFCVYLWGYGEDAAANILQISSRDMWQITWLYLAGIASFTLGTKAIQALRWSLGGRSRVAWNPLLINLKSAEAIAIMLLIILFLILKVALLPLGVYQTYAFDSGAMDSAIWTASMFASEAMLLVGILVLFSKTKHNVAWFVLLSLLNGINLMHGTRVFFIITVMVSLAYAYIRGRPAIWRVLVFGPFAFLGVLLASYVIFLIRSSVSPAGAFTVGRLLSPIVYESVFSQMSLLALVTNASKWSAAGHIFNYFGDVFVFTIPRLLLPGKGEMIFHNRFADLAPMGAFNGYADGLIYFGLLFPVFYFVLGLVANWLYRKSRKNSWWFVLYIYFSTDFLFRIMRDGYMIPSKMLINTLELICGLIVWRPVCKFLLARYGSRNASFILPPNPS